MLERLGVGAAAAAGGDTPTRLGVAVDVTAMTLERMPGFRDRGLTPFERRFSRGPPTVPVARSTRPRQLSPTMSPGARDDPFWVEVPGALRFRQ